MIISIVICTYNRDKVLAETLNSYLALKSLDEIDTELLIIDNNSSDATRDVANDFIASHQGIRYIFEAVPGLSQARNTGIRESTGDIIVFVDDDVFFDPYWLLELNKAFKANPDLSCVGGKVIAHFEEDRPDWLADEMLWVFAVTQYGDKEKPIIYPDIPIGCNMAFRKDVFKRLGGFDTSLGRKGTKLLSGEENALFKIMHDQGIKVLFSPGMLVNHRVFAERLEQKWIYDRFYWQGISDIAFIQSGKDKLSRGALISKGVSAMMKYLRLIKGGRRSPVNIFQWIRNMPVKEKAKLNYQIGVFKHSIMTAFMPKM